jgi:hypothetical protein
MELIKVFWIIIFFLFTLTLLFVWSKMYIISRKIKHIASLIDQSSGIDEKKAKDTGSLK